MPLPLDALSSDEGIAHVATEDLKAIAMSNQIQQSSHTDTLHYRQPGVDTHWIYHVTTCNQAGLTTPILFYLKNHSQARHLKIRSGFVVWGMEVKAVQCKKRGDLVLDSFRPMSCAASFVDLVSLAHALRNLNSILDLEWTTHSSRLSALPFAPSFRRRIDHSSNQTSSVG
jgi:hypothetical protein